MRKVVSFVCCEVDYDGATSRSKQVERFEMMRNSSNSSRGRKKKGLCELSTENANAIRIRLERKD
jgi:hypothetical protein